ncbi:hypothetical protein HYALB_00009821 [Hymenoscyphus albidus]|uniref:NACHT domain-containing protein n=1 Tax=Hymenoscyphus albidus TaxID=595503 RepID=A0A9N9LS26_9HELO|nr:hypothetical protein HYALB_00009821 [Hymenoscyphus albidus]
MSLIYSEGKENALRRLKKKIQKLQTGDEQNPLDPESQSCIQDLRITDPREDKKRIEDTKGGLLRDSYQWILEHPDFQQWRDDTQSRLLWVKGDPGKGKTMLISGILDELSPSTKLRDKAATTLLSYFFCQATDGRINNASAALRGLIYLLIDQQPLLISYVRKKYDHAGKALFEDPNAWVALSEIFTSILQDPSLTSIYLIIDALDECKANLDQLLDLISRTASTSTRVKWIVSSRNEPNIEARLRLDHTQTRLSLELNKEHVSRAVQLFIDFKVSKLRLIEDDGELQETIRGQIYDKANGTFLWAALVLKELEPVESWDVLDVLQDMPPELEPLYDRMLCQVEQLQRRDPVFCRLVLSTITLAYRPLHLLEVGALSNLPEKISTNLDKVVKVVNKCGSFLTVRENRTYFIHQSAKDFLLERAFDRVFPSGKVDIIYTMFSKSLEIMSKTLRRDIYELRDPGFQIEMVEQPVPDPLAAAQYSCLYWVDHLLDCDRGHTTNDLIDGGSVHQFLKKSYMFWLEGLSLMKSLPDSIMMIMKLENWIKFNGSPNLLAFIHDARRFSVSTRSIIEQAPLQAYCSALVFAPEKSVVREAFESYIPPWIQKKPRVEMYWNAMLQALEGHTDIVTSVAFSPDGKQIVSGSWDHTVRRWDAATGQQLLPALEGHTDAVTSVAFSPDGKQIVSGSRDQTVRRWDAATGQQLLPALEGHTDAVTSVAFSPDGKQIVSGSRDQTVRRWDAATGQQLLPALEGHTDAVTSVAFSPDGKQIVSGSRDQTVRRWDAATGQQLLPALEGHTDAVTSVAFSPDGKQIVSGSRDQTVRRWDAATGQQLLPALEGHTDAVTSVAFSPDGKQIVSGSRDQTVRRWDAATGQQLLPALEGHTDIVTSVAFSPDGKQIVSGSRDQTVRRWDAATGQQLLPALEGHTDAVTSVAFSPDGKQIVSGSRDQTVRRWDAATGQQLLPALEGHTDAVASVAFSPDGKQIVSGSNDKTVRRWDTATGQQLLPALEGYTTRVSSVAFSPDGKQIPTLHVSQNWLADGTTNLLWLPTGYRPTCQAAWGGIIALGLSSGGLLVLQFEQRLKLVI